VSAEAKTKWSTIVAMSAAMLHHAEAGEWLELAELENHRRVLINADMHAPSQDADCAEYAQVLQTLLSLDQQTMALAHAGQTALVKQLQVIAQGRSAVQAYAQQSR
jgi:3-deoxy-D-manno-octulosonic acid (KDO) 8-phosphate synthase